MTKQITQPTGRFYQIDDGRFLPSVTTVLGFSYPKGPGLQNWVGTVGLEEAERIKVEAGEEGTAVHEAIDKLIHGTKVPTSNLSEKQKRCLAAFLSFWQKQKPQVIDNEYFVYGTNKAGNGWAGSVDFKGRIAEDDYQAVWLLDWKTSKSLHDNYGAQLAAYMHADWQTFNHHKMEDRPTRLAAVHLGNSTRVGWSFKEYDPEKSWKSFELCLNMFHHLNPDAKPKEEIVYPEYFQI